MNKLVILTGPTAVENPLVHSISKKNKWRNNQCRLHSGL